MKLMQEKKDKASKEENAAKKKEAREIAKKEEAKKEAQAKIKNFLTANPPKSKAPSVKAPSVKPREFYSENMSAMQKRVNERSYISSMGNTTSKELSYYRNLAKGGSPNKLDNQSQFKDTEINSVQQNENNDGEENDSIVEDS